jgi:hypothetical protein
VREGEVATKVAGGAAIADRDLDERRMLGQLIEAVLLKHEAKSWASQPGSSSGDYHHVHAGCFRLPALNSGAAMMP